MIISIKHTFLLLITCLIFLSNQAHSTTKNDVNKVRELSNLNTQLLKAVQKITISKKEIYELVETGADINVQNDFGDTPLIFALQNTQDVELIKELLNLGADINKKNIFNSTALMFAAEYNSSLEIFQLLVKAGAEISAINNAKFSALTYAVSFNENIDIIIFLLKSSPNYKVPEKTKSAIINKILGGKSYPELSQKEKEFFQFVQTIAVKEHFPVNKTNAQKNP